MLRAVLLGMLSVSAVVACKGKDDAAKVQPGVAAGKVLEVKGTVTVKHGDASRPLAAGESVEGDDTVITGADGNVVIELAHNLVRWELGPNKQQKVRESIAWRAAKSTGPAQDVEQDTAAAGRPAERSAAGTSVSAVEEPAPAAAAPAPPPPPAAEPEAAPTERAPARPARMREKRESAKAAPPREPDMSPADDEVAPSPRRTRGAIAPGAGGGTGTASLGGIGTVGKGAGTARAAATAETAAAPVPSVASLVAQKQGALKQCLGDHKDEVRLLVTVTGGKASVKFVSKTAVSAALETCMKKVLDSITFTSSGSTAAVIKP